MKAEFNVRQTDKLTVKPLLKEFHYLSQISRDFKSGFIVGLFQHSELVGVTIFSAFPVPELAVGLFDLNRTQQEGLWELSRLCLHPKVQKTEHSLASWFVAKAIKLLRSKESVKAILSYADSEYHEGIVYKACNFRYFGLSAPKKDFWIKKSDGTFLKHNRGKMKGLEGEWRNRSQKHRFLLLFDSTLKPKWNEILRGSSNGKKTGFPSVNIGSTPDTPLQI